MRVDQLRRNEMTKQQYRESQPTRQSIVYHADQGCDIHHKTNRSLDACEDRMETRRS